MVRHNHKCGPSARLPGQQSWYLLARCTMCSQGWSLHLLFTPGSHLSPWGQYGLSLKVPKGLGMPLGIWFWSVLFSASPVIDLLFPPSWRCGEERCCLGNTASNWLPDTLHYGLGTVGGGETSSREGNLGGMVSRSALGGIVSLASAPVG